MGTFAPQERVVLLLPPPGPPALVPVSPWTSPQWHCALDGASLRGHSTLGARGGGRLWGVSPQSPWGLTPAPPFPGAETTAEANLCWSKVTVKVKDVKGTSRTLLREVNGCASPGSLHAIMGPSGCGKTTLLNALSGRLASTATLEGAIMVNGHKTRLSYGKSAYVTQDEMLIAMLTVRETIMYAARLRLAGDQALHESVTDTVISDLGLTEVAHTYIGNFFVRGISGGQRKRVGIGCELVVSPTLLFLDEVRVGGHPTPGAQLTLPLPRVAHVRPGRRGGVPRDECGPHAVHTEAPHHHRRHPPAGRGGV